MMPELWFDPLWFHDGTAPGIIWHKSGEDGTQFSSLVEENISQKPRRYFLFHLTWLLSPNMLTWSVYTVDMFKHLSVQALSFLAAKVKRARHISYLAFIYQKRKKLGNSSGRQSSWHQLERKFLMWAPVRRALSKQFGSQTRSDFQMPSGKCLGK